MPAAFSAEIEKHGVCSGAALGTDVGDYLDAGAGQGAESIHGGIAGGG
ncbi:MAG: hypothetical protein WCJ66_00555 [Verrucomicrobiota bacterium]